MNLRFIKKIKRILTGFSPPDWIFLKIAGPFVGAGQLQLG